MENVKGAELIRAAHRAATRCLDSVDEALLSYGELVKDRRASQVTPDDAAGTAGAVLSLFLPEPQFHGQTKEKLGNPEAAKLVESVVRDHFDHWLSASPLTCAC